MMDLDQRLSEFKKIVDQLYDGRFDDGTTSMQFDADKREPRASHIAAAEVPRAIDSNRDLEFALGGPDIFLDTEAVDLLSQNLVQTRISSNETQAQVSIAAVQSDHQILAKQQQKSFELQQLKLDQLREEIEQKMIELKSQQREHERQRNLFEEQKRKHVKCVECSERPSAKVELKANLADVRENRNCTNELIATADQEASVADQKFEEMQFRLLSNIRRLRFKETRRYRGYKWLLGLFNRSKPIPLD